MWQISHAIYVLICTHVKMTDCPETLGPRTRVARFGTLTRPTEGAVQTFPAVISLGESVCIKKKGKCLLAGAQWLISLAKKKKNPSPIQFPCIFAAWSFIYWRS